MIEGGDDKGYDNTSGVASGRHQFDNGVRAGFSIFGTEVNTEYDGSEQDFRFQTAGVNLDVPVASTWRSSLHLVDARDELADFIDFSGVFDTRTRSSRLENWITAGTHEFVLGAEYRVDKVESTTAFEEGSHSNEAYFGQALLKFGRADVHLSLRGADRGHLRPGVSPRAQPERVCPWPAKGSRAGGFSKALGVADLFGCRPAGRGGGWGTSVCPQEKLAEVEALEVAIGKG